MFSFINLSNILIYIFINLLNMFSLLLMCPHSLFKSRRPHLQRGANSTACCSQADTIRRNDKTNFMGREEANIWGVSWQDLQQGEKQYLWREGARRRRTSSICKVGKPSQAELPSTYIYIYMYVCKKGR